MNVHSSFTLGEASVSVQPGDNPAARRYVEYAESLLERAQVSTDPEWTDTLNRMAGQMMEIAIYLGAKTH
jgi:RNase P subunit RPR2